MTIPYSFMIKSQTIHAKATGGLASQPHLPEKIGAYLDTGGTG